jgi:DNA ligase-1
MLYPILYKKTSTGATQQWQMEIEGSTYRTISGQVNGKLVTSDWKQAYATNVGRANERNPEEQAIFEVEAQYTKKLERDYHKSIDDISCGSHIFEPMLAYDYKKAILKKNPPVISDCFSQRKLNGLRCIMNNSGVWSRKGKPYVAVPHIYNSLSGAFKKYPNLILDGELYNNLYASNFEELVSVFKQSKPTDEDLKKSEEFGQYHVYDLPSHPGNFEERFEALKKIVEEINSPYIILVETHKLTSQEHCDTLYKQYLAEGYEGQIIRENKVYENKRTWSLLKRKEFMDAEFELVDILEGLGNWSGKAKSALLKLPNGETFNAGITGTMEFCEKLLKNKDKYIGKPTTVNFFQYTTAGVPLFPRVKEIAREDI